MRLLSLMEDFRQMTNDCIRIGIEFEKRHHRTPSRNTLSRLSYAELRGRQPNGYSGYLLCASTKAAGILSARRKSIKRGFPTKKPYLSRPGLVSCYGFRIENAKLLVHLNARTFESIPLNAHTQDVLCDPTVRVRSFTLTEESVSL
jgi:putative transposase